MAGQYKAKGVIIGAVFFIAIFAFSCKKPDYICHEKKTTILQSETIINYYEYQVFGDMSCMMWTKIDTSETLGVIIITETSCREN